MTETHIPIAQLFKPGEQQANAEPQSEMADGSDCAASEPFALSVTDDSMLPEFDPGCIIIIDPGGIIRDGAFVLAKDLNDDYIFRRLRITGDNYHLEPLNTALYQSFQISGKDKILGVITQRAGKRRAYHKWYDN